MVGAAFEGDQVMRTAYDGVRVRVPVVFPEDEVRRTKQEFKDDCDINNILRKFRKTGVLEHVRKHGPEYGFAPAVDYHEAMNLVLKADAMYADLPSDLRKRFKDPAEFLEFVQDPENAEEMLELGLRTPKAKSDAELMREAVRDGLAEQSQADGDSPGGEASAD